MILKKMSAIDLAILAPESLKMGSISDCLKVCVKVQKGALSLCLIMSFNRWGNQKCIQYSKCGHTTEL